VGVFQSGGDVDGRVALKGGFMRIDWQDIWSTLLALYLVAMAIYPAMSGESIFASIQDGTFWSKALNVGFAFLAARHKGRNSI
jgi:hypothetical protein